jgi:broad specificity phosphatase PhoE
MVQVILIRPGASDYVEQGRIQGTIDMPLSRHGADEVAHLAHELSGRGIETVYTGTCHPTLETAAAIAEALDVKLKKLKHMQNLDHGLWQGMLIEEVRRKQPTVYRQWQDQPESIRPPQGETLSEARARVDQALAKILKKHKSGVIGLVLPEPLASLARAKLTQRQLGDLWEVEAVHGGYETLQVEPVVEGSRR